MFRRRFGRFTATFSPPESALLADLVDQVRQLLAARRADGPTDPLATLTGMTVGVSVPPADPALARLLPDFHSDDDELAAGMRLLHEPEVIGAKDAAAVAFLDTLPRGGGTVRLDEAGASAWLTALNDVRLALGVRLDITEDLDIHELIAQGSERSPVYGAYQWLAALQDSLVTCLLD